MRTKSVAVLLIVAIAGCGGDTTGDTEPTTTLAATTPTTAATTTTTVATTTSTTVPTTTTAPAPVGLPDDACDQIDPAALQEALGVDSLRGGSPFSTSGDGTNATCRFAITISGNLGSAFTVNMLAPSDTGAFETASSALNLGEPTELTGLGTRAALYQGVGGPLLLVEYENGAAAWASADSAGAYVSGPADATLAGIMDVVIGPVLRAIP